MDALFARDLPAVGDGSPVSMTLGGLEVGHYRLSLVRDGAGWGDWLDRYPTSNIVAVFTGFERARTDEEGLAKMARPEKAASRRVFPTASGGKASPLLGCTSISGRSIYGCVYDGESGTDAGGRASGRPGPCDRHPHRGSFPLRPVNRKEASPQGTMPLLNTCFSKTYSSSWFFTNSSLSSGVKTFM